MITRQAPQGSPATGFTLVELLVFAGVLVVLSSISFPLIVRFYEEQKLRQTAIELQSQLLLGRTLAQRLQSVCGLSISSGAAGAAVQVSGTTSVTNNACASDKLPPLNLSAIGGVRNLCVSNTGAVPSSCSAPADFQFIPLGVLAGGAQTLYLAGSATPSQFCVELSLTLIRVGFRNSASGACTYSRS